MTPAQRAAIQIARSELQRQPVYLDTETTGREAWDEIVEICLLESDGSVCLNSLVRPTRKISREASAIHGLTDDQVTAAPTWPEVWSQVEAVLTDRRVAIYNAAFDVKMLARTHRAHGLPWTFPETNFFCVMLLYAQFKGDWNPRRRAYRWHRLEEAGRHLNIALPNAHRAQADARLTREVLLRMAATEV
jgi:DNA polymerase-3 subunit epsilon